MDSHNKIPINKMRLVLLKSMRTINLSTQTIRKSYWPTQLQLLCIDGLNIMISYLLICKYVDSRSI